MRAALGAVLVLLLVVPAALAASPLSKPPIRPWQPNGTVNEVLPSRDGGRAYLAGDFSYVGPFTGSSVRTGATGAAAGIWPTFSGGAVTEIVPDPVRPGGWFVGGSFTRVGTVERRGLARIDPAGRLDLTWNAGLGFDGTVTALAVLNDRLYVGGSFTAHDGMTVGRLTAFDVASANPDGAVAWTGAADAQGDIEDIEVADGAVWIAGAFTAFHDGATYDPAHRYITRLRADTGAAELALAQPPAAMSRVLDIEIDPDSSRIIAAGSFTAVDSPTTARRYLAAWDRFSGALDASFDPNLNGTVYSIDVRGGFVYAGGGFTTADNFVNHQYLRRFRTSDGTPDTWAPAVNDIVTDVELSADGATIYVGGFFTRAAGVVRHGGAAFSTVTSAVGGWSPMAGDAIRAIRFGPDGSIVLGGQFDSVGGSERNGLAAIDLGDGSLVPDWNPAGARMEAVFHALELYKGYIHAGGSEGPLPLLIRFDADNGAPATGFNPTLAGTNAVVRDLDLDVTTAGAPRLLVAGSIGGGLHAIDPGSGASLRSFGLSGGTGATSIDVYGGRVFVGGSFTAPYPKLASFDLTNDAGTAGWSTTVTQDVSGVEIDPAAGHLLVSGPAFTSPSPYVRVIDRFSGADVPTTSYAITPAPTAPVTTMHATSTGTPYLGSAKPGAYVVELAANGAQSYSLAALPWYAGSSVTDIASFGTRVLVGTSSGFLVYEDGADTTAPAITKVTIQDAAADGSDGTVVDGQRVFVRTNGSVANPWFTVNVRAHDMLPATGPAGYAEVSGLDEVQWDAVPDAAGTWTPGTGYTPGAARGLDLRCWLNGYEASKFATGIDTAVDYPAANPPDKHDTITARLVREAGAVLQPDNSYDNISCRWRGYVLGRGAGDHVFQTYSDNGMQLSVGGPDDNTWPTVDNASPATTPEYSVPSAPVYFAAGDAKRFDAKWYDGTGAAVAQVLWQPPGGTSSPIPAGAFVRSVDYQRTYRYVGGVATSGSESTVPVRVVDRAGIMTSAPTAVRVAIDNTPPAPSPITSSPAAGTWSNSATISITFSDGADGGSGFRDRTVQKRFVPLAGGTCSVGGVGIDDLWTNVGATYLGTASSTSLTTTEAASNGCWQFRIRAHDRLGNQQLSYPAAQGAGGVAEWVRIDRDAPSAGAITVPLAADTATSADPVTIDVTSMPSDALSGIDPTTVKLQREEAPYSGGACGGWTNSVWSITVTAAQSYADTSTADGRCYRYRLMAADRAGTPAPAYWSGEVRIDRGDPAATIAAPADPIVGDGSVTLTGSATDGGSGIDTIDVAYTGPMSGTACTPVVANPWSCSLDVTAHDLADGSYSLTVTGTDVAGNTHSESTSITVDRTDPLVTLAVTEGAGAAFQHYDPVGANLWINRGFAGEFAVDATVSDTNTRDVQFANPGATGWGLPETDGLAPWTRTYAWSAGADVGPLVVTASDEADNTGSATITVDGDEAAPIASPPSYTAGYGSPTRTITWAAPSDAGSGVGRIDLEVATATLSGGACGTFSGFSVLVSNATSGVDDTTAEGTCRQYRLAVYDNVGNRGEAASSNEVQVDTIAPGSSVDLASPTSPMSGAVQLQGTASDADGAASVDVMLWDGATEHSLCIGEPVVAGAWTCDVDTTARPDGTYVVRSYATDHAGNVQTMPGTRSVTIDNTPPDLSPGVSGSGAWYDSANGQLWVDTTAAGSLVLDAGAVDSGTGTASVDFPTFGGDWTGGALITSSPFQMTYTWTAGAAAPGALSLVTTDNAGATQTVPIDVLVDATAPTGGSMSYDPTSANGMPQLTFSAGTDGDSGLASWRIVRRSVAATSGTCGSFDGVAWTYLATPAGTTYEDATVQRGNCYEYAVEAVDQVGTTTTYTDPEGDVFIANTAGLEFTPAGTPVVAEGGTVTYFVALRAAPSANVEVALAGDDDVTAAPAALQFRTDNWNVPQQVTVTATNDAIDEPTAELAAITHEVTSVGDLDYDALTGIAQPISVTDDDTAGVQVLATGLAATEGGAGGSYQVRLASQPLYPVTVTLTVPGQVTATPTSLTFLTGEWATPKTVTVAAVDDGDIEGAHTASIAHAANSLDGAYVTSTAGVATVAIADNDVAALEVLTSSASPTVEEKPGGLTETVRVRLTARPTSVVNVSAAGVAGQVTATPSSLQFTSDNWSAWKTVTIAGVDDNRAETSPHAAMATFAASSTDANFAGLEQRVVNVGVTDDDPAGFISTPGTGWVLDSSNKLQLKETGEGTATMVLTSRGAPSADVIVTPVITPEGEVEVSPKQLVFPAGVANHSVTITIHAIDDRVAEPTPHPARASSTITTQDPLYQLAAAQVTSGWTDIAIEDGLEPVIREETPTPTKDPVDPPPAQPTDDTPKATQPAPTTSQPNPAPTSADPAPPAADPAPEPQPDGTTDGASDDAREEQPARNSAKEDGERERDGNAVTRAAGRLKDWASDNKAAASVGASAAGTAALWGAKPLMLAGKALGGGGLPGMPGMPGPDGIGQARRLLRVGRRGKKSSPLGLRLLRRLLRRARDVAEEVDVERTIDQDWDDFYNNRAA